MTPEFEEQRRLARRRWAKYSFYLLAIQSSLLWLALLVLPAREQVATAFVVAWPILIGTQAALLAIVLAYLGVSLAERAFVDG